MGGILSLQESLIPYSIYSGLVFYPIRDSIAILRKKGRVQAKIGSILLIFQKTLKALGT